MLKTKTDKKGKIDFIATLLIILISFSIITMAVVLNRVDSISDLSELVTGYGTKGQVNITISQNLTINVIQINMTFGVGQVVSGRDNATINSTTKLPTITTDMLTAANWSNTSVFDPLSIVIRNDGNVNASINFTSNKDASTFIGGTSPGFQYISANNETGSCLNDLVSSFTDVSTTDDANEVCSNLSSIDFKDEVKIDVQLVIPNDAYGDKECDWNFTAWAVT